MPAPSEKPATQDKSVGRHGDSHSQERVLDRLADPTPSRLGVEGAMRARDVSRPTPADLAEAERTMTIRYARPSNS